MKARKYRQPLPRYYMESPHNPLGRVAPCLDAMIDKLSSVRMCCERLSSWTDGDEASLRGMSRVIFEVEEELYEASEVLKYGLDRVVM